MVGDARRTERGKSEDHRSATGWYGKDLGVAPPHEIVESQGLTRRALAEAR